MGNKKPTFNYAKAKLDNRKNDQADYTVEFGKENTFDQINLTPNETTKNKPEKSKQDEEFGEDQENRKNNRQFVSRNKKNNREGKQNRGNKE